MLSDEERRLLMRRRGELFEKLRKERSHVEARAIFREWAEVTERLREGEEETDE